MVVNKVINVVVNIVINALINIDVIIVSNVDINNAPSDSDGSFST